MHLHISAFSSVHTRMTPRHNNTLQLKVLPSYGRWHSSKALRFHSGGGASWAGFFLHGATAPSGSRPPHCRDFTITLRHTTLGRTPLDEWSVRRRDLYLTTHNTHKTDIHAPGGIRTRNPSKREAAGPCLTPRGHWNRLLGRFTLLIFCFCVL